MNGEQARFLEEFFERTLYPIVTPLAIDPGHPFPYIANRSLCLVVSLKASLALQLPSTPLSVVHIPMQVVPRFIPLPTRGRTSMTSCCWKTCCATPSASLSRLRDSILARDPVTRDGDDFDVMRGRTQDLMVSIEQSIRERRMGDAVRPPV
jgi:polyphosphate kinase